MSESKPIISILGTYSSAEEWDIQWRSSTASDEFDQTTSLFLIEGLDDLEVSISPFTSEATGTHVPERLDSLVIRIPRNMDVFSQVVHVNHGVFTPNKLGKFRLIKHS
jgi:hypothetical protein